MKINRYKLKPDINIDTIISNKLSSGTWIQKDCIKYINYSTTVKSGKGKNYINFEFSIDIGFPNDLKLWNDYDYVLLLDEDFLQPYHPFYKYYCEDVQNFPVLEMVIDKYNEYMDSLYFLEKIS